MFIDFIGTKAGIRLHYGEDFVLYGTENGMLTETKFKYTVKDMYENEINAFLDCIDSGEKLPSNIDVNILTSQLMDAMYRSAESHSEVKL